MPVSCLAKRENKYTTEGDYWRGSLWAPTNYMLSCGLHKCGQQNFTTHIEKHYYNAVLKVYEDSGTIWENLKPEEFNPGNPAGPDFCGWSALAPISIYREFLSEINE